MILQIHDPGSAGERGPATDEEKAIEASLTDLFTSHAENVRVAIERPSPGLSTWLVYHVWPDPEVNGPRVQEALQKAGLECEVRVP